MTRKLLYRRLNIIFPRRALRALRGKMGSTIRLLKIVRLLSFFIIARLFTCLMTTGYSPSNWKLVIVSMIPKAGKNLSKADGYRPISLSSCLSKFFECSLKARLIKELPDDIIYQAAYKSGRSTVEHLLTLTKGKLYYVSD